jgi:DNA-binding CsgD family transcriptional regulator
MLARDEARTMGISHSDQDSGRDKLLEGIYEAAGDDSRWPSALEGVATWMGSFGSLYYLVDKTVPGGKVQSMHMAGWSAGDQLAYAAYYNTIDPHVPLVNSTPIQSWFLAHQHFDERFVRRDPFFQEFLLPRHVHWITGTRLWETDEAASLMAVQRHDDRQPFSSDDQRRLGTITSHLGRATRLHRRLMSSEFEARLGLSAIHSLNFGMAMVSEDGLVLLSNRVAEDHFSKSHVFKLQTGNRLVLQNAVCNARMALAMAEAVQLRSTALPLLDRDGQPVLQAMVMPLPAAAALNKAWQRPLAMVILTELKAAREVPQHYLRQLFGLTASEAQLANGLMTGRSIEEYAQGRIISVETARKHLSALFAKTGTRRQAELVALLGRMPDVG